MLLRAVRLAAVGPAQSWLNLTLKKSDLSYLLTGPDLTMFKTLSESTL